MRKQIPDTLLDDARKWSNRLDQDGKWRHQIFAGLLRSVIGGSLQHIEQEPQLRPVLA
jgi:hypothetical protein